MRTTAMLAASASCGPAPSAPERDAAPASVRDAGYDACVIRVGGDAAALGACAEAEVARIAATVKGDTPTAA